MLECDSLDKEPVNRPGLVQAVALHGQVQVTVVLDRVAIGVEKSRVPVAQCLVAFGTMERQAYVTAGDVEPGVLARHDYHRCLGVRAMVTGTGFGHVDDRRIVEHRAVSLGNGLEPGHQGFNLLHVMGLDGISHVRGTGNLTAMPDLMDTGLLVILRQSKEHGNSIKKKLETN